MSKQLTTAQAAILLDHLEDRFSALCEHYEAEGYREERADNALDELSGLRYMEPGSGLSPVDAVLILSFLTEVGDLPHPDIITTLEGMK
ncbi:MAG: hypothetical protein ACRCUF_08900 [Aeromonas sobria]